jgi:L-fucose/D-arabinose isomerase
MGTHALKAGIVSFSHAPVYASTEELEKFVRREHDALRVVLEKAGIEVVHPLDDLRARGLAAGAAARYGISTAADLDFCVDALRAAKVDCLVISVAKWPRIALISALVTALDVPTALYASTHPDSVGEVTAGAAAASILEMAPTRNSLLLERFRDTENGRLLAWIRGAGALRKMLGGRLLMWGGAFGADVPCTRDDEAALENRLIREILVEQEVVLVDGARRIEREQPKRIDEFLAWLRKNKVTIKPDGKMLTDAVLRFSAGHYLAAKDRIASMADENILGVSVKCHFETSTDCVGCTLCLVPGFIPFGADSEGPRPAYPVACEGDLKALLTMVMLHQVNPAVPPLFGDTIWFRKEGLLLSNCGSSSVWWAGRSSDPSVTLPRVSLMPQLHGKSGSSVFSVTPAGGPVTYARLYRVRGRYYMYLGAGVVPPEAKQVDRAPGWPQTQVSFGTDPYLLYATSPSNHGCLTEGDVTAEVEAICRAAGIGVVRCDSNESMTRHLEERAE